jgi:hypothetical protein
MLKAITLLILIFLIVFILLFMSNIINAQRINKQGFTSQNLGYYYKDIMAPLYKYDEDSLTFKDAPSCNCGYLTVKNTDIAVRDPKRYRCPNDIELKPLLREYLLGEENNINSNMGWRNVLL